MACECIGCGATIKIGDRVSDSEGNKLGRVTSIISEEHGDYFTVVNRGKAQVIYSPRDGRFQIEEREYDQLKGWLESGSKLH